MIAVMVGLALTIAPTWEPGPDDPVCEPGQVVDVDHCAQGQLPGEVIGREIGDGPFAPQTSPASALPPGLAPATPTELAHTGVHERPTGLLAVALIGAGAGLVLVARRAADTPSR